MLPATRSTSLPTSIAARSAECIGNPLRSTMSSSRWRRDSCTTMGPTAVDIAGGRTPRRTTTCTASRSHPCSPHSCKAVQAARTATEPALSTIAHRRARLGGE